MFIEFPYPNLILSYTLFIPPIEKMDHGIAFESTTDKKAKRREKQEARQQIIDKVINSSKRNKIIR